MSIGQVDHCWREAGIPWSPLKINFSFPKSTDDQQIRYTGWVNDRVNIHCNLKVSQNAPESHHLPVLCSRSRQKQSHCPPQKNCCFLLTWNHEAPIRSPESTSDTFRGWKCVWFIAFKSRTLLAPKQKKTFECAFMLPQNIRAILCHVLVHAGCGVGSHEL